MKQKMGMVVGVGTTEGRLACKKGMTKSTYQGSFPSGTSMKPLTQMTHSLTS